MEEEKPRPPTLTQEPKWPQLCYERIARLPFFATKAGHFSNYLPPLEGVFENRILHGPVDCHPKPKLHVYITTKRWAIDWVGKPLFLECLFLPGEKWQLFRRFKPQGDLNYESMCLRDFEAYTLLDRILNNEAIDPRYIDWNRIFDF